MVDTARLYDSSANGLVAFEHTHMVLPRLAEQLLQGSTVTQLLTRVGEPTTTNDST